MDVSFICPACYQEITAGDEDRGAEAVCPNCEAAIRIPLANDPPQARLGGYVLEQYLGAGRLGMVYLARQSSMNRQVALKILSADLCQDEGYVRHFVEEIRLNAQIDHPHVVKFFDVGEADGRVYAAMSHVQGRSLRERLRSDGPLDQDEALAIGATIARTLDYVWETHRILHQNLNPGNVYLDRHGQVKLMNLGVTRHSGGAPSADGSAETPSVAYMSPEQLAGQPLDIRSDIYSLGATLFELLTGRLPEGDGAPPLASAIRTELRPEIVELVGAMLVGDAAGRHQNWAEVIAEFDRVQHHKRPLRQPDGSVLTEEAIRAETRAHLRLKRDHNEPQPPSTQPRSPMADEERNETQQQETPAKKLGFRRDKEESAAAEDEPIVTTAAAEAAEGGSASAGDTPTTAEVREPGEAGEADADGKKPKNKVVMAIRGVVLVLALWLGWQYGISPIISHLRGKMAYVIVTGGKPDQNYVVKLGWRRLTQPLRGGSYVTFSLNVGMPESQGLSVYTIAGGDEVGRDLLQAERTFAKKIKVPLNPTANVLVNIDGTVTYNIYNTEKVKTETVADVGTLYGQIAARQMPVAAAKVASEGTRIGGAAFIEARNDEVIDLDSYRTFGLPQRSTMEGGEAVEPKPEDPTLPMLTHQALDFKAQNATVKYDHSTPANTVVSIGAPQEYTIEIVPESPAVKLNKGAGLTVTRNGDAITVNGPRVNVAITHNKIAYNGTWSYTATAKDGKTWTWTWTYGGNRRRSDYITDNLRITLGSDGKKEIVPSVTDHTPKPPPPPAPEKK